MERPVRIIGAPTDYGADRRGVDMGPSAIRYAGLTGRVESTGVACSDAGDLSVPGVETRSGTTDAIEGHAKFLGEVAEVSRKLSAEVAETIDGGSVPLVLGGDHSVAIGTLAGAARDREVGVVWFDAHGDFNTPATTPSGNVHGMSLAAALGHGAFGEMDWATAPGLSEEHVALVGLRNLDPAERERIRRSSISAYTMSDVDDRGMSAVVADALDVASAGEFVEVNPILDERNQTARLATELAASAFGDAIL